MSRLFATFGAVAIVLWGCASTASPAATSTGATATLEVTGASSTPSISTPTPTRSRPPAFGTWSVTGNMVTGRMEHSATRLPDGKILVVGGSDGLGDADNPEGTQLASAELYDPAAGTWTVTGSMSTPRSWHTATLLPNGNVLVAGGFCNPNTTTGCPTVIDGSGAIAAAELYDSHTGTWSATGSMATERFEHTATVVADGKVLVAGGELRSGTLASTELYDPATGKWTATGSLITARWQQFTVKLGDGKVLMFGGCCPVSPAPPDLSSTELYDPSTGKWTASGDLITGRAQRGTAALLDDGKVIVAGGDPGGTDCGDPMLASAELYDPASGTWSATAGMNGPRVESSSTLLASGQVFVAGGFDVPCSGKILASAELFDPNTSSWIGAGSMSVGRFDLAAVLLANGQVLVTGGALTRGVTSSAELYDPGSGS